MTIHRFKAETLEDAYQAMRQRLGEDAVVLSTETVTEGGILGFLGRKVVEIRASAPERRPNPRRLTALERRYLATEAADVPAGAADPQTVAYFRDLVSQAQARMRSAGAQSPGAPQGPHPGPMTGRAGDVASGEGPRVSDTKPQNSPAPAADADFRSRAMDAAQASASQERRAADGEFRTRAADAAQLDRRRASDGGFEPRAMDPVQRSTTPRRRATDLHASRLNAERSVGLDDAARSGGSDSPRTAPVHGSAAIAVAPMGADGGQGDHRDDLADDLVRRDIGEMRDMLRVMFTEMPGAGLPSEFVPYYRLLLKRGLTREAASDLIAGTMDCEDPKLLHDRMFFLERLKMRVRKNVRVTGGVALEAGRRKVIALVGPTGVGKTTNIAKLAAQFALKEPAKLGLITADTYRIAATDQLKVYANIIGVEMAIVYNARDVAQALERFRDCDVVLMDTAGGSPFNQQQMADVRRVLEAARVDETMLVLSAGTQLEDLQAIVRQYGALSPHSIFFTKLDETRHYGALYCLAREAGLPLSYFSYGQNVPDDVVMAHQSIVAKLVVDGGDSRVRSGRKPA